MNNPHNCGVSYVVHILTALPVRQAPPALPARWAPRVPRLPEKMRHRGGKRGKYGKFDALLMQEKQYNQHALFPPSDKAGKGVRQR